MTTSKSLAQRRIQPVAQFEPVNWKGFRGVARLVEGKARSPTGNLRGTKFLQFGSHFFDLGTMEDRSLIRNVQAVLRTHETLGTTRFGELFEMSVLEIAIDAKLAGFKPGTESFEAFVVRKGTSLVEAAEKAERLVRSLEIESLRGCVLN